MVFPTNTLEQGIGYAYGAHDALISTRIDQSISKHVERIPRLMLSTSR